MTEALECAMTLSLLRALRAQRSFEEAGRLLAERILALVDEGDVGQPLSVWVHLRPQRSGGAYEAVAGASASGGAALPSASQLSPSVSLWTHLVQDGVPLLARRDPPAFFRLVGEESVEARPGPSVALRPGASTHLAAFALRSARPEGMVTIEVRSPLGDNLRQWRLIAPILAETIELVEDLLLARPAETASAAGLLGLPVPPSPAFAGVLSLLARMAELDEPLVLYGPTGVGKSQLAEACHAASGRAGPFVSVNLLAVPESLRSAELFGWRRGAATGLEHDNPGRVATAEGGTLFLDEVDRLGLGDQQALLEFLETRSYRRLGDPSTKRANVRIVAATNANLRQRMADGSFLPDLFWRLNTFAVRIPGIEERRDEIAPWALLFLRDFDQRYGGKTALSAEAAAALTAGAWPGNLRELRAVVGRARLFTAPGDASIRPEHLRLARQLDPAGDGTRPAQAQLRALARLVLRAERERPNPELRRVLEGALWGAVVLEGSQDAPTDRVAVIQALFDSRNASRARENAEETLAQLDAWLIDAGRRNSPM